MAIDDESHVLKVIARVFEPEGMAVTAFDDPKKGLAHLSSIEEPPSVLVSDIHMPGLTGLEVLVAVRELWPKLPVILMTGQATIETAIDAVRLGAYDYLVKPFRPADVLPVAVRRALAHHRLVSQNERLRAQLTHADRYREMVGASAAIRRVKATVASVARADSTVLIIGESGTGKELVARAIHRDSQRAERPFIAVNCAALTETMLESELFGHVRGAFTGAVDNRRGLFEEANGGTLFLDEVGELSAATQVRLLRVLQEREVRAVGSDRPRPIDVRVVAATHRNLRRAVEKGSFREDLYYRLNVIRIDVPPLRDRIEDLPALARHILAKQAARLDQPPPELRPEVIEALQQHTWPGNVRELENALERALVLGHGERLSAGALPPQVRGMASMLPTPGPAEAALVPFNEARNAFEAEYLRAVLARADGNIAAAARLADVDRSNLRRLLKRHSLL